MRAAGFQVDLKMSESIAGQRVSQRVTFDMLDSTYHSKARTMHAWVRATRLKAQVHFEFGVYMIDLDLLFSKSFIA